MLKWIYVQDMGAQYVIFLNFKVSLPHNYLSILNSLVLKSNYYVKFVQKNFVDLNLKNISA